MFVYIWSTFKHTLKDKFVINTLNFLGIFLFINMFQRIFGSENTILGVSLAIIIMTTVSRDMTATPVRHALMQGGILLLMAVSSCLVSSFSPIFTAPLVFATIFIITYAFTYEAAPSIYFIYLLSYLFLIYSGPVNMGQLPLRIEGVLVGVICLILYQMLMMRGRIKKTAKTTLDQLVNQLLFAVTYQIEGTGDKPNYRLIRKSIRDLSKTIYDRRRNTIEISMANMALLDVARGLEYQTITVMGILTSLEKEDSDFLTDYKHYLEDILVTLKTEKGSFPRFLKKIDFKDSVLSDCCKNQLFIQDALERLEEKTMQRRYVASSLSFKERIKCMLDVSPIRISHAFRMSILLTVAAVVVYLLDLQYGKWLMFTLASLTLPNADEISIKTRKRITATLIGGLIIVITFSFIPDMQGRMVIVMAAGYLSAYFADYTGNYSCSTIGALGGAMLVKSIGFIPITQTFLIRVFYICLGGVIAFIIGKAISPINREKANSQLKAKYETMVDDIGKLLKKKVTPKDAQAYYYLVMRLNLFEEQISHNLYFSNWKGADEYLAAQRKAIRAVHNLV